MPDFKKAFSKFVEKKKSKREDKCCSLDEMPVHRPFLYFSEKTAPELDGLRIGDIVTIKAKVTGVSEREDDGKKTFNYDLTCEEYAKGDASGK
jgi:hypothetical protein